jgi:formylmethanofuran dehydrogenase subunit D
MCTDHRQHVLTSSGPGVYLLTVRKIIFQIDVLESMHKKITQNEIAACASARIDSVDLKELCITFCVIIQ